MLQINQSHVIVDNTWLWRADHTKDQSGGLGVTNAVCQHALIVNGDSTTFYGLAVEHTLQEQVLWNADKGQVYFLQSEFPYDVASDFKFPMLKIADSVDTFFGRGLGSYCFFNSGSPNVPTAIEAPNKTGVNLTAFTKFLTGTGSILKIVNSQGTAATGTIQPPQWLCINN